MSHFIDHFVYLFLPIVSLSSECLNLFLFLSQVSLSQGAMMSGSQLSKQMNQYFNQDGKQQPFTFST